MHATTPQYLVTDPSDWSGSAYVTTSKEDAFEAWRCNTKQQVTLIEFTPGNLTGKAFIMDADFEEMLAEEGREGRAMRRHYDALAREARVSA